MMHRLEKYIPPVAALILAMVTLNSADVIHRWWDSHGSAISWQGVEVVTKTVRPGEDLKVIYSGIINRQCPAEIRGFLVAPDGTVPVRFPMVAGGYSDPSDDPVKIRVSIAIPKASDPGLSPLDSGRYVYRALATRYCPGGIETDSDIPDAEFNLEVPR